MNNCGILALSKIKDLKGVSAFTLIHLGKDNGVELKLFKVKESDLTLVHRPAIFHSENHFEFIKNGEPLPDQKWTGFVLTEKSIGRPISHKEAKTVVGEMPGAVTMVAGAAAKAVVAAVGIANKVVGTAAQVASLPFKGAAALAGLAGGAGAGGAGAAGGAGVGGGAVGAGVGGTATGAATALGAGTAPASAGWLSGLGSSLASGAKSLLSLPGNIGSGIVRGATGTAIGPLTAGQSAVASGLGNVIGGASLGAVGGKLTGTGALKGALLGGAAGGISSMGSQISSAFGATPSSGFNLGGSLGQAAAAGSLATIAKQFGPKGPEGIDFDPLQEYTALRDVLGTQGLPPSTEAQILKDVNTPLAEMAKNFSPASDRTLRQINQAFDLQTQNLHRQFAQAGQNMRNSSEFRAEMQELEQRRAVVLGEAEQEAFNTGLSQAIQSKQFALNASIQNQQFDVNLALELADAIGQKEMLTAAIQQQDEAQFNSLLAQILNIGFGGQDTALNTIAQQLMAGR